MTSFWEILKSSKNLKASDAFAELWGKSIADSWDIITITGTLPLTFEAQAGALTNYRLYGTENGAGVETENLAFVWLQNCSITASGTISANNVYGLAVARVESGQTYAMRVDYDTSISIAIIYAFFTEMPQIGSVSYNGSRDSIAAPTTVFTAPITGYIATWSVYGKDTIVHSATAPTSYIPYGYKIPLTVTSGEQSDTYPIYIGNTQLMDEEYVDYQEQKVYKFSADLWDVNGVTTNQRGETRPGNEFATGASYVVYNNSSTTLYYRVGVSTDVSSAIQSNTKLEITPKDTLVIWLPSSSYMSDIVVKTASYVDPPAPFPTITAYKGENTLSSTETVGEVSVTGKIKEI